MPEPAPRLTPVDWYLKTPDRNRRRVGLALIAIAFIMIGIMGFFPEGLVKTALQVDFENYARNREREAIGGAIERAALPKITMIIDDPSVGPLREYLLDPADGEEAASRTVRMLSLMKESHVFGMDRGGGPGVKLKIDDGKREYTTTFRHSDVKGNVRVELLMKLMTVHGKPPV